MDTEESPEDVGNGEANEGDTPLNVKAQWNTGKYTYTHHKILSTLGYQFVNIQASSLDISGSVTSFMTTPLTRVPCHGIPFYMSRSEFNELPPGSQVTKCFVEYSRLDTGYHLLQTLLQYLRSMLLLWCWEHPHTDFQINMEAITMFTRRLQTLL